MWDGNLFSNMVTRNLAGWKVWLRLVCAMVWCIMVDQGSLCDSRGPMALGPMSIPIYSTCIQSPRVHLSLRLIRIHVWALVATLPICDCDFLRGLTVTACFAARGRRARWPCRAKASAFRFRLQPAGPHSAGSSDRRSWSRLLQLLSPVSECRLQFQSSVISRIGIEAYGLIWFSK
jgi:hypothetical protein